MNTKLDNRKKLVQLVKQMNESDAQQMLAFLLGMDIGKKLGSSLSYLENRHRNIQ